MSDISKPLILIVEDDIDLAKVTSEHLELAGMYTQAFGQVKKARDYLLKNHVNLIILDIRLPDTDGFSFLEEIRKMETPPPVIFVTGNDSESIKIRGFEVGADDYITKPFSVQELIARIKAVLRRTETRHDLDLTPNTTIRDKPFEFLGATVNSARLESTFPDGEVETAGGKEIGILNHLHLHQGAVIPRTNLIHAVWGPHADIRSRSLDQYIVKIRDIFKKHGCEIEALRTVHGVGFIYDPPSDLPKKKR